VGDDVHLVAEFRQAARQLVGKIAHAALVWRILTRDQSDAHSLTP
jgi:hypothetical protein